MRQGLTVDNATEPAGLISQETLGKVIRELRREAALSQQELADRAGITKQVISNIETGHCHIRAVA